MEIINIILSIIIIFFAINKEIKYKNLKIKMAFLEFEKNLNQEYMIRYKIEHNRSELEMFLQNKLIEKQQEEIEILWEKLEYKHNVIK